VEIFTIWKIYDDVYILHMDIYYYILLIIWWFFAGLFWSTVWSGGLVSLPVVIFTGLPIHIAIATHRLWVVILEWVSAIKYHKEVKIDLKLGILFWCLSALWATLWSHILIELNEKYLRMITAVLLIVVFIMLTICNSLGVKNIKPKKKHWYISVVLALILWIYGSIFWAWFGTLIMFCFILIWMDYIHSSALSRITWFIMSLTATIIFAVHWLIHYPYGITLWVGFALWAWVWVWYWVKKWNSFIKKLFILLIIASVIKLIYDII